MESELSKFKLHYEYNQRHNKWMITQSNLLLKIESGLNKLIDRIVYDRSA